MSKKLRDGKNKKLHNKLIEQKKKKIADEKAARKLRLKAMYAQMNAQQNEEE